MWLFRFLYSVMIFLVFVLMHESLGIDIYYAVTYAVVLIFSIYFIESLFSDFKSYKFLAGAVGGIVFSLIAYLLATIFDSLVTNEAVKLGIYFFMLYLGIILGMKVHWVFELLFSKILSSKQKTVKYAAQQKVLDTSTLIDGRIADIVDTELMEGALVIPTFVLKELQNIADSHDHLRRQKGAGGLMFSRSFRNRLRFPLR
ncbi:MAG: hypothetical protein LRY51_15445 [Geovibrio sp.]|nr:hypothetical protein [Geovibrio sp.]